MNVKNLSINRGRVSLVIPHEYFFDLEVFKNSDCEKQYIFSKTTLTILGAQVVF